MIWDLTHFIKHPGRVLFYETRLWNIRVLSFQFSDFFGPWYFLVKKNVNRGQEVKKNVNHGQEAMFYW